MATKSSSFRNVTQCFSVKITYVSEEHIGSIFRVEEQAKQEKHKTGSLLRNVGLLLTDYTAFFFPEYISLNL
jgi:hypothetical protein